MISSSVNKIPARKGEMLRGARKAERERGEVEERWMAMTFSILAI